MFPENIRTFQKSLPVIEWTWLHKCMLQSLGQIVPQTMHFQINVKYEININSQFHFHPPYQFSPNTSLSTTQGLKTKSLPFPASLIIVQNKALYFQYMRSIANSQIFQIHRYLKYYLRLSKFFKALEPFFFILFSTDPQFRCILQAEKDIVLFFNYHFCLVVQKKA